MVVDVQDVPFAVGQKVARPYSINKGGSAGIEITTVTKVTEDKVYLDNSPQPIKCPWRLAVLG